MPKAATDGKYEAAKHVPYPQIVDALLYAAVITRPDIAHAVSVLHARVSVVHVEVQRLKRREI